MALKPTRPERIEAKPLRHPGRWITAAILVVLFILFIVDAAGREAYGWSTYRAYLFDTRILDAALRTLALTVLSMICLLYTSDAADDAPRV